MRAHRWDAPRPVVEPREANAGSSRRIGRAQAILGSMLNIKPLLFMEDGEIIPLEKVRTHEKAIEKLFEFVAEFSELEQAAIVQRSATQTKETKLLLERLAAYDRLQELWRHNPKSAYRRSPETWEQKQYILDWRE